MHTYSRTFVHSYLSWNKYWLAAILTLNCICKLVGFLHGFVNKLRMCLPADSGAVYYQVLSETSNSIHIKKTKRSNTVFHRVPFSLDHGEQIGHGFFSVCLLLTVSSLQLICCGNIVMRGTLRRLKTYFDAFIRLEVCGPISSAFSFSNAVRDSGWRDLNPRSVRLYSCATTSSSTPHKNSAKAQMTPVLSLPAASWRRMGDGVVEAKCSKICLNGWVLLSTEEVVQRISSY